MPNHSYTNVFTIAYVDMYILEYIYTHVYGNKALYVSSGKNTHM